MMISLWHSQPRLTWEFLRSGNSTSSSEKPALALSLCTSKSTRDCTATALSRVTGSPSAKPQGKWKRLGACGCEESGLTFLTPPPKDNEESLERFLVAVDQARATGLAPEILHIAASAAATDLPPSRLDLVRVGISVYGVSPFDERTPEAMGFLPVMAPRARVTGVDMDSGVARVGMGYGEGLLPLPPPYPGGVSLEGARADIHEVNVDHILVGIPSGAAPGVGDIVTLWGG